MTCHQKRLLEPGWAVCNIYYGFSIVQAYWLASSWWLHVHVAVFINPRRVTVNAEILTIMLFIGLTPNGVILYHGFKDSFGI